MLDRIYKGLFWDESLNLVHGCTPVSEECRNCWSARETKMHLGHPNDKIRTRAEGLLNQAGAYNGTIRLNWSEIGRPLRTRRPRAYCIWTDLFHPDVPLEFIDSFLKMADTCRPIGHIFIIITKHPELALEKLYGGEGRYLAQGETLPNIWFLVTIGLQKYAEPRLAAAMDLKGCGMIGKDNWPVVGVLAEPLLGPLDLWQAIYGVPFSERGKIKGGNSLSYLDTFGFGLDLIACGGESGSNPRPTHFDWVRSLRDQALDSNVPFLFKGWGNTQPGRVIGKSVTWIDGTQSAIPPNVFSFGDGHVTRRATKAKAGRLLDGVTWDEVPGCIEGHLAIPKATAGGA